MVLKRFIILALIFIQLKKSFGQIQDIEIKNKHTIGFSILPLTETLFIPSSIMLKTNYAYILKHNNALTTSVSFFKRGVDSYSEILGGVVGADFNIYGGQIKFGFRNVNVERKLKNKVVVCNIIGFEAGFSYLNMLHDIVLTDALNNTLYYRTNSDLSFKSVEMQFGKAIRFTNKVNLSTYVSLGMFSKNIDILPIKRVPGLGIVSGGLFSGYINITMDLYFNLKK
jgi:hypothetical protein